MDDFDSLLFDSSTGGDIADGDAGSDAHFTTIDVNSLAGNGSLPVVSDITTQSSAGALNQTGSGGSPGSVLGSIFSEIQALPKQGAALGSALGTAKADIAAAQGNFNLANASASSGNTLGVWWANASTTDKLIVGLTAATVVIMIVKN